MEQWEVDFHWLKLRHFVKDRFKTSSLPDMETILFLIGVQELGKLQTLFSKEEKMQLMHIAAAKLLSEDGYYTYEGKDENGWPVWKAVKEIEEDEEQRNNSLKRQIVSYFDFIDH